MKKFFAPDNERIPPTPREGLAEPRLEVVVTEEKLTTTTYTDGTTRKDQRLPAPPPLAPVTANTPCVWTRDDLDRMHGSTWMRVQAGGEVEERQPAGTERRTIVRAQGYESGFDNT